MLTFAHPWLFLLLPLPWLVRKLLPGHHERKAAVRVPFMQRLSRLVGLQPGSDVAVAGRRTSQWLVLSLTWFLVVIAIARPQWLGEPVIRELPMRDLLVAVDLSGSMEAEDFTDAQGNTVETAKARELIGKSDLLFRRNSTSGAVECLTNRSAVELNEELHSAAS